jgi:uncharacterized protein
MAAVRAVDFRLRPPTEPFSAFHSKEATLFDCERINVAAPRSFVEDSVDVLLEEMETSGVETGIVIGRNIPSAKVPNDHIAELQSHPSGRFVGFAGIDPAGLIHDPLDEIDRAIGNLGLKGVAVDPGLAYGGDVYNAPVGMYPTDPLLYPIYEKCQAMKLPVEVMTGPYCGRDISYSDPAHIDRVSADFPDLVIIAGHGGWPYATELIAVGLRRPNVYVSPDIYMFLPGNEPYVAAANGFLADQMLFATAYPARDLQQTVDDFLALPINEESQEKVLYGNAARILGL